MTFINTVKSFKYTRMVLLWNAYSVVANGKTNILIGLPYFDSNIAVLPVILYGVIAQVEQYFRKQAELSANINIFAFYGYRDIFF